MMSDSKEALKALSSNDMKAKDDVEGIFTSLAVKSQLSMKWSLKSSLK